MSEKCLLFLRVSAAVKLKTRAKYRGIFQLTKFADC